MMLPASIVRGQEEPARLLTLDEAVSPGAIAQSRVETGGAGDPQTKRSLERSQDATLPSF